MRIKIPKIPDYPKLPLTVIIRSGRELNGLLRCIDSIDANVEIIASIADDASFIHDLCKTDLRLITHKYGNWSIAAQCGIDISSHSNVVIMDGADSIFEKGALQIISQKLNRGNLIVQPKVVFKTDNTFQSKILSSMRTHEYTFESRAYSPGLGLNVSKLIKLIGLNGDLYDRKVNFGDDGALNQRRKKAGIDVFVASNAVIYHDPLTFKNEFHNFFQFGIGEKQAQKSSGNVKKLHEFIYEVFFSKYARNYYKTALQKYGIITVLQIFLFNIEYIRGFQSKKNIIIA